MSRATHTAPLAPAGLADDLERRHRAITRKLDELGATCLVAVREQSVTYLTGYTTMTWKMDSRPIIAVLCTGGRLLVVAPETEVDAVKLRIPGAEVRAYMEIEEVPDGMRLPGRPDPVPPHAARVLGDTIEEAGAERVAVDGLDAAWPPIGQLTRLVPQLDGRTVDASGLIWAQCLRKTDWELERMRVAAQVLADAYTVLRERLEPGMTERDIACEFSIAQLESGAHEVGPFAVVAGVDRGLFGFPTDRAGMSAICSTSTARPSWTATGRTSAEPSRRASPAPPKGRGTPARAGALDAAVEGFRPGFSAGELGLTIAAAMDIAPGDVGFGRFGHGLGLNVEPPSLHGTTQRRWNRGSRSVWSPQSNTTARTSSSKRSTWSQAKDSHGSRPRRRARSCACSPAPDHGTALGDAERHVDLRCGAGGDVGVGAFPDQVIAHRVGVGKSEQRPVPGLDLDGLEMLGHEVRRDLGVERKRTAWECEGELGRVVAAGRSRCHQSTRSSHASRLFQGYPRVGEVIEDVEQRRAAERPTDERQRVGPPKACSSVGSSRHRRRGIDAGPGAGGQVTCQLARAAADIEHGKTALGHEPCGHGSMDIGGTMTREYVASQAKAAGVAVVVGGNGLRGPASAHPNEDPMTLRDRCGSRTLPPRPTHCWRPRGA